MKAPLIYMEKVAYTAREVSELVTPGRKYPFNYLTGEIKELMQAIKEKDKEHVREEKGDVLYAAQMLLHQNTGLNFKLRGADQTVGKFLGRREMWEKILGRYGVAYHPDLFVRGSNYRKKSKIKAALQEGGYIVSDRELSGLEPLVGGFEKEAALFSRDNMKAPIVYMHKMADSVAQGDLWDAYEQYKQTMNTPPSGTSLIDMLKKRPYVAAAIGLGGLGLAGGAIYAAKRADKKYDQLWEKERESTDNIHE